MRGPVGRGKVRADGRRRAGRPRNADLRGERGVIGRATGRPVSITGLGCYVPERVLTNDDLAKVVDTSDEWIRDRTGIRERRIAAETRRCPTSRCRPPAPPSTEAGVDAARDRPDHRRDDHAGHGVPGDGGARRRPAREPDAAAYDLSAGCTGFMYALAQAHAVVAAGLAERALVIGGDVLSRDPRLDATARRSCSSATAPARSCSSTSTRAASSASSSAPTARAARSSSTRGAARASSTRPTARYPDDERARGVQVRDARARELGGGRARRLRADGRRRRRVRSAPGERPHHRPRCATN